MKAITNTDKFLERISNQLDELINAEKSAPETFQTEKELDGRWTCDICDKDFATEKALKTHKTKVHK